MYGGVNGSTKKPVLSSVTLLSLLPKERDIQKNSRLFKKDCLEKYPITARSLERYYHIDGDQFERQYKEYLSDYRMWDQLSHAENWLLFPENLGPYLSIDETSLSMGSYIL